MTPEQRGLEFLGKFFIAFIITLMGIISFGGLVDILSNGIKKPIQTGGNVWKNWDYSRSAQDVKSYDYNNHTVTYREYRPNPAPSYTPSEGRTVLWSWSPKKKAKVTIRNGEMEIPVKIDLEDLIRDLPESNKQDLIQSVMDNVDYNDLLDYYGSPELR